MNKRIDYIDGLKGLAALSIFTWHFCLFSGNLYWPFDFLCSNTVTKFLIDGCVAVCLFILLSGYSNGLSMTRKNMDVNQIRKIIARRYLRLAVPIAPILIIIFIMRYCGMMCNIEYAQWASWDSATQYYNDSTMNYLFKPWRMGWEAGCKRILD